MKCAWAREGSQCGTGMLKGQAVAHARITLCGIATQNLAKFWVVRAELFVKRAQLVTHQDNDDLLFEKISSKRLFQQDG